MTGRGAAAYLVSGKIGICIRKDPSVFFAQRAPFLALNVSITERLVLRRLDISDAPFIIELLNDPAFIQYIGDRGVRTTADAQTYLANGPLASYAKHGFGLFLVSLKAGDIPIGICGLLKRDVLEDVDIGFAFLPAYVGKGYAFEAASATLDYGRTAHGLKRIVAVTSPHNASSIRLIEKLGLRYEKMVQLSPGAPEIKLLGRNF